MTTSSVTIERMKGQIHSCEELSGRLQEVTGRIQRAGIGTGLFAEASAKRREVPLAGEALEHLKGEAERLSRDTENLVKETRDMLRVATKRYTGKESKQIIADLRKRIFELEDHKGLLLGALGKGTTQKRKLGKGELVLPRKIQAEASKETSLEQKRTHEEVEGSEEEAIPAKKVEEEKPAQKVLTELNEFSGRYVALAENYDSIEGRVLFRDMMKYDFFRLEQGDFLTDSTFSYEEKAGIGSALQEIERWKERFLRKYASEQQVQQAIGTLKAAKESIPFESAKALLDRLRRILDVLWEKENAALREEMKKAIPQLEERLKTETEDFELEKRLKGLSSLAGEGVSEKEQIFPSVPTSKPTENTEYIKTVDMLIKRGTPPDKAEAIAPQAMLQADAIKEQKEAMEEVSQKQTAALREASLDQQKRLSAYGKPVLQKLRFIGRASAVGAVAVVGMKGFVENNSLWDAAFTVAGTTFESLILVTGPELAYKAYAEWDWKQICAATGLGVGTVIIFGMSTPVLGAAAGVALVAGEMSKNPTFRETIAQIVEKTWEGTKKITQNLFIGNVDRKAILQ